MEVERLPRKLWYRWTDAGQETEYGPNIPTPIPEIKCDAVQVTIPPTLPNTFYLIGLNPQTGNYEVVASGFSYGQPIVNVFPWDPPRYQIGLRLMDWAGNYFNASGNMITTSWYTTPGDSIGTRRDLLIGGVRIQNPTVNAPCPTWRFTGGNCPPGSIDCGNCCLDCASIKSSIDGLTAAVLPYSTWRPK